MKCVKDVDLFTAHNLSIKVGGLGTASRRLPNGLVVGAIVAVNAVGEVRLPFTGEILAGARGEDGNIRDSLSWLIDTATPPVPAGTNTTIAVVARNANLNKVQANKVAQMAHNGLAKTIHPVYTMSDGDTIFAIATGVWMLRSISSGR